MARNIFIDCGGHDGCSVIQFLWQRPGFEVVTFEPNPVFTHYYRFLPTRLIQRAVGDRDGTVSFTVDPIDGDGSSILPGKDVVFDNSLANEQCPTLEVGCVDLSSFIARNVSLGDYLCLKLDVEGAEYAILEKMIREGTIDRVDELLVEFHWFKCGVAEEVHDRLVAELEKRTVVSYWDATSQSIHRRGATKKLRRALMLAALWPRHALHGGLRQRGLHLQ